MAFSLDQFYRLNRRALIWIILAGLIWLSRDFFSLIFLTFILAFISTPLASVVSRTLRLTRRISIILVYGMFLIALVSFARFTTPSVIREAAEIGKKLPDIEIQVLKVKNQLVDNTPWLNPIITGYIRSVLPDKELVKVNAEVADRLARQHPQPSQSAANPRPAGIYASRGTSTTLERNPLESAVESTLPTTVTLKGRILLPSGDTVYSNNIEQDLLVVAWMNMLATKLLENMPILAALLWRLVGTLLLAILFSFLITMDIARLRGELESLRSSRLHDLYEQAAQPVVRFAYVVGRSFQAQAAIACVNALLTLIGLLLLGIPSLAVLTLLVFLCSFIPVLGVFISSTPIVLVALNSGGLSAVLAAIIMVGVIHAIEAYLLNPLIYGRHLKLNPVLVLLILFVGHHAFGVWGMLLGVPVAYYFIHDVFGVPVWGEMRLAPKNPSRPLGAMPQSESAPGKPTTPEPAALVGKKEVKATPGKEPGKKRE